MNKPMRRNPVHGRSLKKKKNLREPSKAGCGSGPVRSDPKLLGGSGCEKNHSGSGPEQQLRIRNEFEVKLYAQFKNMNSFLSKKYSSKKLISRLNEQPNMLTRQEYKSKIYRMSRILEQIYVGSETGSGSETNRKVGSRSGENHSGSKTLFKRHPDLIIVLSGTGTVAYMTVGTVPYPVTFSFAADA
jgi:hypothetical protein